MKTILSKMRCLPSPDPSTDSNQRVLFPSVNKNPAIHWVEYYFGGESGDKNIIESTNLSINSMIGKTIHLKWTGQIFCVHCATKTKKTFGQGYCFSCFSRLAQCDQCITRPELCHYHVGTCREPEWGQKHCMIQHTIYLANTSHLKVGVTRTFQQKTRWMDQGASEAIVIGYAQTRRGAGRIEALLKGSLSDQTNWQKMLKGSPEPLVLVEEREKILQSLPLGLDFAPEKSSQSFVFNYPVTTYPISVRSLDLEKIHEINAVLTGIKGQYLITDAGVLNVRKHSGFEVTLDFGS